MLRLMVKRAAGLVIFRWLDNTVQYLLLKASYGSYHWSPPKGHVDPGESDWATALRETREEAGLEELHLEIFKDVTQTLEYRVKGIPKTVIYWLAWLRDPLQEVTLSDEHTALKWLPLLEAQKISGQEDFSILLQKFDVHAQRIASSS